MNTEKKFGKSIIMEKRRIEYFDTAKFIGMMMIILGHFGVPEINRFVYTFHIPLFFLISGYFYAPRESTVLLVKNKFRQLYSLHFSYAGCYLHIWDTELV